jgi:hypothetical protein
MHRLFAFAWAVVAALAITGCAHPISITANLDAVSAPKGVKQLPLVAGLHVPDSLRFNEVTTPAGGGDKVRYFPYRDLEPGIYHAMSLAFTRVERVSDPRDTVAMRALGVRVLVQPRITTTSSTESALTWPPTRFTVTLTCSVVDPEGKPIETVEVTGEGRANFSEFVLTNQGLAGSRAAVEALTKLAEALALSKEVSRQR